MGHRLARIIRSKDKKWRTVVVVVVVVVVVRSSFAFSHGFEIVGVL
jgi:hypothetical protein